MISKIGWVSFLAGYKAKLWDAPRSGPEMICMVYPACQLQLPVFSTCHCLTKISPGLTSVPSGMVTSSTKIKWFLQVEDVVVGVGFFGGVGEMAGAGVGGL